MIPRKLLEIGKTDRQTRIMLAGMVNADQSVRLGDQWAKFKKDGPRSMTVLMGKGEGEANLLEEVTVSNQPLAKQMVIDWVCGIGVPQEST